MEEYLKRVQATTVPTYEEYQASTGKSWSEYVAAYSATAAQKQVAAGEIPSEYGQDYSFTAAGVWVPSGSPAAIGGLPGEIKGLFPGVEETYQQAYKSATEGSVITTSRVAEPQTSFVPLPTTSVPISTPTANGGSAPLEFNDPGTGMQQNPLVGGVVGWQPMSNGNGGGNGAGEGGGLGLLALLALALGMGGL